MERGYLFAPLMAADQRLSVSFVTYNGRVQFGLCADEDSLPDLTLLVQRLSESMAEIDKATANMKALSP